jgi:hypothetical protein
VLVYPEETPPPSTSRQEIFIPMTPDPSADCTIGPDTPKIAFTGESMMGLQSDIYLANPDGSCLTQITTDAYASAPQWSPDGQRILYTALPPSGVRNVYRQCGWLKEITVLSPDRVKCQMRTIRSGYSKMGLMFPV